ncbi:hypothetical protein JHFBIEKO_4412 [Methylobacterium mesophilicum]|nr:hypothetical protein [Methylobacterium mesophilicum]GJE23946.1 hypothetical protein JHFBIEKO_4412 [Methylobacterium mesophilicum]
MSSTENVILTLSRDVTGRDAHIIGQALHVAAKALLAEPFPQESNAEDILIILEALWPGSEQHEVLMDRIRDGRGMGLPFPEDMSVTAENVEAWIAAELAERGPTEFLMATAIEEVAETTGILTRCSNIRGVSDHDARMRLHQAKATIRVMSGMMPGPEAAVA